MNILTLKDMALIKYGTIEAFAEAAGRSIKSAKRLLDPAARLNLNDMYLLIDLLDIFSGYGLVDALFFGDAPDKTEAAKGELIWIVAHRPDLVEPLNAIIDELLAKQAATV